MATGAGSSAPPVDLPTRLEHVLADEALAIYFRNFLHKTACAENLSFWLEVELLKELDENEQRSILKYEACLATGCQIYRCSHARSLTLFFLAPWRKRSMSSTFLRPANMR